MIENITVDTFDLSSLDESTGLHNTAKVYWVDGINRPLPLAQLVMAICLERAAAKENDVVGLMNELTQTTQMIEELANYQNLIVQHAEGWTKGDVGDEKELWPWDWAMLVNSTDDSKRPPDARVRDDGTGAYTWIAYFNTHYFNPDGKKPESELDVSSFQKDTWTAGDVSKILDAIDTKLDSLNTTSQKTMILLQSETTKRDQTYDLISVMVKSIGGANTSIAASMR